MQEALAEQQGAMVRIVRLDIPNHILSEELFGPGIQVQRCEIVFRQMLPTPPEATLQGVMKHGVVLLFPPQGIEPEEPTGLLVPWSQISYMRFIHV